MLILNSLIVFLKRILKPLLNVLKMGNLWKILSVPYKLIGVRFFFFFFVFFPFVSHSTSIWSSKCGLSQADAQDWLSGAQVVCSSANGGGSTFEGHVTTDKLNNDFTWTYCAKYRCDGCTSNDVKQDSIDLVESCTEVCLGVNTICSSTGLASYNYNIWDCSETPLTTGVCAESSSSSVLSSSSVALSSSVGGTSSAGDPTSSTTVNSSNSTGTLTCYSLVHGQCVLSTDPKNLLNVPPMVGSMTVIDNPICQGTFFSFNTNIPRIQQYLASCYSTSSCGVGYDDEVYYRCINYTSSGCSSDIFGFSFYCDATTCYYGSDGANISLPSNVSVADIYSLANQAAVSAGYSNYAAAADYCKSIYSSSSGSESSVSSSSHTPVSNSSGTSSPWGTSSGSTSGGFSGSETGNSSGSNGGSGGDYPSTHSSPGTWDDTKYSFGGNPDSVQGMEEDSPWAWRSDVWSLQKLLASGFSMVKDAVTNITGIAGRVQDSLYSYNHQSHSVLDSILQKIPDSLQTTASASQDSAWHSFQAWAAQSLSASSTETYGDSLGDYNDSLVRELITNGIYNDSVYNAKIDSALRGLGFSLGDCNDLVGGSNNLGTGLLCGGLGNGEFAYYMRNVNTSIQEITGRMSSVNSQLNGIQNAIDHIPKSDTGVIDAVTDLAAQSASEHNGSVNAINSNGTSIRSQIETSSQALIDAYADGTGDVIGTLEKWGDSMTNAINGIGDSSGTGNDSITVSGDGIEGDGEGFGTDYTGDGVADSFDTTGHGVKASTYDSLLGSDAKGQAALTRIQDSAVILANTLREATETPFNDASANCPIDLMAFDPCSYIPGSTKTCFISVCDPRFFLGGEPVFHWFGLALEFGAWLTFFMSIKLSKDG